MKRRLFLQQSLAAGTMGMLVGSGLLLPRAALALWPAPAFQAQEPADVLQALFDSNELAEGPGITLTAPEMAENPAGVPIKVSVDMPEVESITIVAVKNPLPLIASFKLGAGALPFVATRVKLGGTGDVIAVVKAGGKLYSAQKRVKVSASGCG
ncbi:MAG: thiosulfate oxidation carrier protein SoxY [Gammaproteobacteria bacterium]